ncbi:MAG TPA: protein kinase [Thermoanaerobaculia bacterium]|jgi:predicted Ser/Thr protein kinase|nr:protein kinase [Thermoanaerobaculia bacterium]
MLSVGSRVGPYEIVAPIGAGGMGEVWKARDTRLDRSVAIKILPAEFAKDSQLKLRFEREARTISQLEHPHICRLYDVGDDYLVMELLEGESLADRIGRGPLPLADVLKYGSQIAAALDRAHRAGIVHRDLKPGNVMISKGAAKLLDFGLARESAAPRSPRAHADAHPIPGSSPAFAATSKIPGTHDDPTELRFERPLTERGTILGTVQHMAPEQFDGVEADARTDIFALGTVLYEMVTGKPAFAGKSRSSLIAAIVDRTPTPISQLQPLTPPSLEHVVMKCLEKEPDERWQSAHDIAQELRWIADAGSQVGLALPTAAARRRRQRWMIALAAVGWIAALAGAGVAMKARQAAKERRLLKTEIVLPLDNVVNAPVAVSPDGFHIATVLTEAKSANPLPSANEGESILAIRDLAGDQLRSLPGTEGATYPFWAPDGSSVGFFATGKLKTVNISSGTIEELCDAPNGRGGSWSPLGVIIFTPNIYSPLMRVPDSGGTPTPAVKVPANVARPLYRNPHFFPDGKRFFYTTGDQATLGRAVLMAGSLDGDVDRKILDYGSNVALVDDWLITARVPNLIAQRFDSDSMQLVGKPVPIGRNVDWYWARFQGLFAVGGSTLVFRRPPTPVMHFLRLDPGSDRPSEIREAGTYNAPHVSPDGRSIIVNRFDASTRKSDPWLFDFDSATWSRITFTAEAAGDDSAIFSPDGKQIAIASSRNVRTRMRELWTQPVGGAAHQTLAAGADYIVATDWSRDEKSLVVSTQRSATGFDIEIVDATRGGAFVPVVKTTANEINGRLSPDGKWLAYESDDGGRAEIYVTNFPAATAKWQVSTEGGRTPYWSADGRAILFLHQDRIMTAPVRAGSLFNVDMPRELEQMGDRIAGFSVASNGTIVALRLIEDGKPPLSVVVNWQKMLGE